MGAGASKRISLDGKTTEQARNEAASQVQQMVSGYDSDVDNELGFKYAGRRELVAVADGSGQGLAEKPWFGAIHAPSNWKESPEDHLSDSLLLEWAYGYRGYDSRDNLYYTASGEIVYITAGLGVVYDPSANKQRFYFGHTDDVLCLATHPSGSLVATGQIGVDPKICLWDTNSMASIAVIHKCHQRGIAAVAISPDGTRIASIGMDQENTLILHELKGENVNMIVSQKGGDNKLYPKYPVVDKKSLTCCTYLIKFNPSNPNQFVAVGISTVKICTYDNSSLQVKNGLFGNKGPQNVLSLCFLTSGNQSTMYTGTEKGEIFKWSGNTIQSAIAAHTGPVFSLYADGDTLVSGGKDGKILFLSAKLEVTKTFDLREIANNIVDSLGRSLIYVSGKSPPIKSVCRERGKILVGTANCEVIEIDEASGTGKLIVQGQSAGEVWGLACHPTKDLFATACDDKTLRVWSAQQKQMIGMRKVNGEARSVAYSPDGNLLAVGTKTGSLLVVEAETLKEVFSTTIRKEEVSEVKFSPDGKFLAMGSHDNFIDVFDVGRSFKLVGTCKGHASFIIHFDWSSDSRFIQSNCGAYELLFWDARGQAQITKSSDLRDVDWHSWTCILGWPVQGIWQREAKGTDVNAADRSKLGDLLVTADDFGMVNLFKYPAPKPGSHYKRYPGHSAHVTNIRFTYNDKRVISTGGNDKTVLQWRKVDESQKILPNDDDLDDPVVAKELENTNYEKNRSMKEKVKLVAVKNDDIEQRFEKAARPPPKAESGEANHDTGSVSSAKASTSLARSWFAGNHPWLGSIYPPTNVALGDGALPKESLHLDYVYPIIIGLL